MQIDKEKAIKRGKCVYNNTVEYEVKIIKWHTLYGTGDYEDAEDIREDRKVECYYVFYEDLVNKGNFNSSGGGFLAVKEAIKSVESKTNVTWLN